MKKHIALWLSLLTCFMLTQSIAMAQPPVIITVTASEYLGDVYEDTIIPMFEAEHPNIQVEFVYSDNTYFGNPLFEPEDSEEPGFFENLTDYVSSADVLYVSDFTLSPYAVNTGFFMDLSPLVSVDDTIAEADFYPATWDAFQWDGGMWALPYNMEVQLLVYDRNAFDDAGLPYPDETWRLEDFILAAEAMQTVNDQGEIELSPITAINPLYLMQREIGPLYDIATFPTLPDLSNQELINLLEVYNDYYTSYEFAQVQGYSFNEIPMSISFPYQLSNTSFAPGEQKDWAVSLLPGNSAGSRVEGFAISSGTAYPEAAYEFVSFMTNNIDIFAYGSSGIPARRSLSLDDIDEESTFYFRPEFDDDVQALLDQAYEVAISPRELRFSDGFYTARSQMEQDGMDAVTALENIELDMIAILEEAQAQQSVQITVAAPELAPELADNEIILHFGMNTSRTNDRQHLWDEAIRAFVAEHPTVGDIDMDYQIYGPDGMDEEIDCWYNSYGVSFSSLTEAPEEFLALNPLMSADPNFDPNSFLPGVLDATKVADSIYGYPLTVQPMTMWININKFAEANLPIPDGTWTTNDFANAIVALGEIRESSSTPVVRNNLYGSTWLIMLLASFGGQPIDFNSDPTIYNLTDPDTIAAIQQVAGYIQDGLIDYPGILSNNSVFFGGDPDNDFILIDVMGDINFTLQTNTTNDEDFPLRLVTFPDGVYMPVAYSVGMAHINSQTFNLQECYDWISYIAAQPELFFGMPARPALFSDPELIAQQGTEIVSIYEDLTQTLTAPNIMALPNIYGGVASVNQAAWLEPNFFYLALDNTILEDADLETELMQAEANLTTYRECTSGIEQLSQQQITDLWETNEDDGRAYMRQFVDCAVTLVPELRDQYSYYYQESD